MNKPSRRRFLKKLGKSGATALALPVLTSAQGNVAEPSANLATAVIPLEGWTFALDPDGVGESQAWFRSVKDRPTALSPVKVPHTWQVSPETSNYMGVGWYWTEFDAPPHWAGLWVRIQFEAAFHTARVWLNGKFIGHHVGEGYTAFVLDATPALQYDAPNLLAVEVDNSFNPGMLPRRDSYDWATDGGLTRPVSLLVTPRIYIDHVGVDAVPNLEMGQTAVKIWVGVRLRNSGPQQLTLNYSIFEEGSGIALAKGRRGADLNASGDAGAFLELSPISLALKLWHFDHPYLYRAIVTIAAGDRPLHSHSVIFGSRKFEVKGTAFYLNGKPVRLMGVERMAGSNPQYGMAEPTSWIAHDHDDLKELNCVFTRVHWQQDKRVLDYCDQHGILFQEEVPAWGGATFEGMTNEPSPAIMANGLAQLREMIKRDGHHPCIVAWGLCNEVNGHTPAARAFIRQMAEEAHRLDPHRLLTYASNSLQHTPGEDAAGLLDFIEWNEYYESWYPGNPDSVRRNLQQIHEAFPDKPVVISEYGYCECKPDRLGGDARRIEILRNHTQACRESDFVAGAIFFDYNDYRTHVGDKGVGPFKQRVHGVVDLFGNRKPSFEALRQEASPVENLQLAAGEGSLTATVASRGTLPAYTLDGYTLRWRVFGFDDLPMEEGSAPIPKLSPGQQATVHIEFQEKHPTRVRVDVIRPTGFSAATTWWRNAP